MILKEIIVFNPKRQKTIAMSHSKNPNFKGEAQEVIPLPPNYHNVKEPYSLPQKVSFQECLPFDDPSKWYAIYTRSRFEKKLYRALRHYLDVPTELVVYPGEGHGLTTYKNRKAKMEWDLAWFDRYLMGETKTKEPESAVD